MAYAKLQQKQWQKSCNSKVVVGIVCPRSPCKNEAVQEAFQVQSYKQVLAHLSMLFSLSLAGDFFSLFLLSNLVLFRALVFLMLVYSLLMRLLLLLTTGRNCVLFHLISVVLLIVFGGGVYWLICGMLAFVVVLMTCFLIIYHLVTLVLMDFYPLDVLFTLVFLRAVFGLHYFFDLYIRELPRLIRHSSIICYADDITLFQRIPRNRRVQCAADLNTDLQCLLSYGASWLLVFEPTKTQVLTVSNCRDPSSNPPVVMDGVPVVESNLLKFLGYILDSKGLWSAHIDYVVAQSRKRVGALRRICDYLSPTDLYTAYKAFVRPQLEYGHLLYWSAAEGHLARLDRVQLQAQRLFNEIPLPTLESCRAAAAVGLTCQLLSGSVSSPLLSLAPVLMSSIGSLPRRSARLAVSSHPHQLLDQCDYRSLEVFKRSFRGRIPSIWNSIQSDLLTTPRPSWSSCRRLLQRLCTVYL